MNLTDCLKNALNGLKNELESENNLEPLLIIAKNPAISAENEKMIAARDKLRETEKKTKEDYDVVRKASWEAIEKELLALDLITQKQIDDNLNMTIRNGVLYKKGCEAT